MAIWMKDDMPIVDAMDQPIDCDHFPCEPICGNPSLCLPCTTPRWFEIEAEVDDNSCSDCDDVLSGAFFAENLSLKLVGGNPCLWETDDLGDPCGDVAETIFRISLDGNGVITLSVRRGGVTLVVYQLDAGDDPIDCSAERVLDRVTIVSAVCNWPDTITIRGSAGPP